MKRLTENDKMMIAALSRTGRREWDRALDKERLGLVHFAEYGKTYVWDGWSYRTPRTRERYVILMRLTLNGTVRISTCGGTLALELASQGYAKRNGRY